MCFDSDFDHLPHSGITIDVILKFRNDKMNTRNYRLKFEFEKEKNIDDLIYLCKICLLILILIVSVCAGSSLLWQSRRWFELSGVRCAVENPVQGCQYRPQGNTTNKLKILSSK